MNRVGFGQIARFNVYSLGAFKTFYKITFSRERGEKE